MWLWILWLICQWWFWVGFGYTVIVLLVGGLVYENEERKDSIPWSHLFAVLLWPITIVFMICLFIFTMGRKIAKIVNI
jgi:heme/copper-type cytochrome/quinol oxidase subunit 2